MKSSHLPLLGISLCCLFSSVDLTFAQGVSSFTYSGRLLDNGMPVNGLFDMQFTLHGSETGNNPVGNPSTIAVPGVNVTEGLFTAVLDFGVDAFTGDPRWLEVSVGPTNVTLTVLGPRPQVRSVPQTTYAHRSGTSVTSDMSTNAAFATKAQTAVTAGMATNAVFATKAQTAVTAEMATNAVVAKRAQSLDQGTYSNTVSFSSSANSFSGVGAGLTGLNASQLLSGTVPDAALDNVWKIGGTAGTTAGMHFLGTTDNQPLELKVNGTRALRLEAATDLASMNAVNLIGGSVANFASSGVIGATIAGGGGIPSPIAGNVQQTNIVTDDFGTVGGGLGNQAGNNNASLDDVPSATVAGGTRNASSGPYAVVGGGYFNSSSGYGTTVPGGYANNASGSRATIGGGGENTAFGDGAVVGGGDNNNANNTYSTISGGLSNINNGMYAMIPGGRDNRVANHYAFAAGRRAKANHMGTFVWADSEDTDFVSSAANQFLIRASGGVGIGTADPAASFSVMSTNATTGDNTARFYNPTLGGLPSHIHYGLNGDWYVRSAKPAGKVVLQDSGGNVGIGTSGPTEKLHVVGNILATGTITPSSDQKMKKNFAAVDPMSVLKHVSSLPIHEWTYKTEEDFVRHVGPMAQDFYAAFGLGANDVTIATVDADGVALAAIQGLNEKLEVTMQNAEIRNRELEGRLEQKDTEIAELKVRLEKLEQLLRPQLNGGAQ